MKKLFTLLMLFVAIVTGAWADETTFPTSGSYSNGIKKYELSNNSSAVANNKIYWATRGSVSISGDFGMRPYQHAFALQVTEAVTLTFNVKSNTTSARTITGQAYSAVDAFFNVWKNTGVSSSLEDYVRAVNAKAEGDRTDEEKAIHNNSILAGITSQSDNNKKILICETTPNAAIASAHGNAINHNCPTTKGETNSFVVTLSQAGKYVIYMTSSGGSIGLTSVNIEASSKTIATQEYAGVKKGGATLTAGDDFTLSEQVITLADKYAASAAPTDIQLINHRTYTDTSDDYADVDVEFSAASEGYFVGTTTIGLSTYTVKVPEVESYTVSYNAGAYGSGSIASGKKYKNVDFTLSSETFTREGFVQSGWATTDGGEKAYDLGGTYSENAAIELFPSWTEANTYFAAFSVAEGTPAGWTFSIPDPDTWAADNARVAFVKDFADNNVTVPKNDGKMSDSYVAFAKSTSAYAIYDLGSAVTVFGITAKLYGGSGSAFKIKIEYLGEDGETVRYSDSNVSLSAGNWNLNTITKSDVVNDVRYIKIYGGDKWVVMSGFSVTSTADAVSTGAKITTNAGKWASFTPTYNAIVPAGTEAYIITGIGAGATLEGNTVSVMEAGKGYFIKGEASTEYTATYTTEAADATTDNILVGCAKNAALATNDGSKPYQYFLGTDQSTSKAGLFYVGATAITIPAGKCYLQTNSNTPQSLTLPFEDEETAINFVEANENVNSASPTKVIKNGKLYIGNFNVAGQLVK